MSMLRSVVTRRKFASVPLTLLLLGILMTFVVLISALSSILSNGEKSLIELYGEGTELSWPYPLTTEEEPKVTPKPFIKKPEDVVPLAEKHKKLQEIFLLMDKDGNGMLNTSEVSTWITAQVKQHLQLAIKGNIVAFTSIDTNPRNGVVSWEEYHSWFLSSQGLNETYQKEHDDEKHSELQRSLKEKIAWDQAAWQEVARTDPKILNLDEFLAFQHPEASHSNLLRVVEDLLFNFDIDADEALDWDEFTVLLESRPIILPSRFSDEIQLMDRNKEEFKNVIDRNRDGKVEQRELLSYMNPNNARHAILESEVLVQLADRNKDSQLSLNEVLGAADLFFASKAVNVEEKLHSEF